MLFPSFNLDHKLLVRIILISVTIFYAFLLFPEVAELSPSLNDDVFQYSMCVSMKDEFESGGNPIDHWIPYWSTGFPVFHHYQHLPHLIVVLTYFLLFKKVSLFLIYHLYLYLLLVFYPLVVYFSLRSMRLPPVASAGAAAFCLAISNSTGFGFELGSYVYRGSGLFTQAWAMFLFPITLSSIYRTMAEKKGYARSAVILFLLTISQVMFGMMAVITSVLFFFKRFKKDEIIEGVKSLSAILALFFVMIAYFIIPLKLDASYFANGAYGFKEMPDSYGARYVLTHFINGDILDNGRFPILTMLAVSGLIIALGRKAFIYKCTAVGFIMWLLLYFGRPTWGSLFNLIPLASALHLHRFVTMVHFFAAVLAGIALSTIFYKTRKFLGGAGVLLLILVLISPILWERASFMKQSNDWMRQNKEGYNKEKSAFIPIIDHIKNAAPGRTYPGLRVNWGNDFKVGQTRVMFLLGPEKISSLGYFPHSWDLPGDFALNFNENEKAHYDLFNIKYVLTYIGRPAHPFERELKRSGRFILYGVDTSGYLDLVESPIAVYGDKDSVWNMMLLWIRSPMVAEKQHLSVFFDRKYHDGYRDLKLFKDKWSYWDLKGPGVRAGSSIAPSGKPMNIFSVKDPLRAERFNNAEPGRVITEKAGKNEVTGKISADKDCFVLFKMSYHPGWHAYVDGKEAETVILSPGFVGVKVKKGLHNVKFVYRTYKWKMPLLYFGLIFISGFYLWEKRR